MDDLRLSVSIINDPRLTFNDTLADTSICRMLDISLGINLPRLALQSGFSHNPESFFFDIQTSCCTSINGSVLTLDDKGLETLRYRCLECGSTASELPELAVTSMARSARSFEITSWGPLEDIFASTFDVLESIFYKATLERELVAFCEFIFEKAHNAGGEPKQELILMQTLTTMWPACEGALAC